MTICSKVSRTSIEIQGTTVSALKKQKTKKSCHGKCGVCQFGTGSDKDFFGEIEVTISIVFLYVCKGMCIKMCVINAFRILYSRFIL